MTFPIDLKGLEFRWTPYRDQSRFPTDPQLIAFMNRAEDLYWDQRKDELHRMFNSFNRFK